MGPYPDCPPSAARRCRADRLGAMVGRQHQRTCYAGRWGRPEKRGPATEPSDHALGRSRGGFGTKLHVLCDGTGLPLGVGALPGQAHESTQFEAVVDTVRIRRRRGPPRRRPRRLGGDRAYHARRIRQWLRRHGISAVIPPKRSRGKRRRGRPVTYDAIRYRERSIIECSIGWLKECRSIATRYEKLALHYLGLVKLAIIERYLRLLSTAPCVGTT